MRNEDSPVPPVHQEQVSSPDMVEETLKEFRRIKGEIKTNQSVVLYCSVGNWVLDVYAIARNYKDFISIIGKNKAGEECKIFTQLASVSFQITILNKKPAPREIGFSAEMQYQRAQMV